MHSVQKVDGNLIYSDGALTVIKGDFCSYADCELMASTESGSSSISRLIKPETLTHKLNSLGFATLTFIDDERSLLAINLTFKSSDSYSACCSVFGITPNAQVLVTCRSLVSAEL